MSDLQGDSEDASIAQPLRYDSAKSEQMNAKIIYFDNAATTYPKPESVYEAQDSYLRSAANPGRGAYQLALAPARLLFSIREAIARFLGVKDASRLVFTGGCTLALNMALKGLHWRKGDVVVVSPLEHNSVMRPLKQLEAKEEIKIVTMPYAGAKVIDPCQLAETFRQSRPRLCVVAEASNVTGSLLDLLTIAEICQGARVLLMVDAAQSAGLFNPRLSEIGVSIWCASGHKGLFGPPGVGLLYVAPEVELEPLIAGGTGSLSEQLEMPRSYPDHLESGTLAGPAIAGLGAGVAWVEATGAEKIAEYERNLALRFIHSISAYAQVFGPVGDSDLRTGTVAFRLAGATPDKVADRLDRQFGIAVRAGLHCASQAHKALGTLDSGLVRVSFSQFNTEEEVDELCRALELIAAS